MCTILLAGSVGTAEAVSGRALPVRRPSGYPADSIDAIAVHPPLVLSCPSQQNILGLKRNTPFGLPKSTLQENTINMLAIRVEFVREDPDDPTTTGNGAFDLRDSTVFKEEHGHLLDASPHDSAYFGKHIEALNRYWHTVSNGKVTIMGTIYPPDPRGAYTLPHTMAHYGEQDPHYGLTEFYFDAFHAADTTNPEIDFAAYDVFCVFHAGVDRQGDWMNNTPNDLFTGFIKLGAPIPVDGGVNLITEGLIMPETNSQDNRLSVLNGIFAHEFGHQLGLIDLYSTETFITQVGNFSLMDNGNNVAAEITVQGRWRLVFGALPVYPDAWSRAYLGMVPIDTVRVDSQAFVQAAELEDLPPQVVLVPITDAEYFLIENREVDADGNPLAVLKQDLETNVILGVVDDTVSATAEFTREYDHLLPGSGILIWHIDETVAVAQSVLYEGEEPHDTIPNNFETNTLQWDFERRFVSLVEADMMVSFRGDEVSNYGTYTDMFSWPDRRLFSPDTPIPSHSNSGARSGITIKINAEAGLLMDFLVDNDQTLPGFPVWCGADAPYFSPTVIDIDDDGSPEIFVGCGNRVLAWRFDGTPLFDNEVMDTVVHFLRDTVFNRAAVAAILPASIVTAPLASFIDGIGDPNLMVGDAADSIRMWRLTDFHQDGFADHLYTVQSEFPLAGPAMVLNRPGSFAKDVAFGLLGGGTLVMNGRTGDSIRYADVGRTAGLAGTETDNAYYLRDRGTGTWHLRKLVQPSILAQLVADTVYGPVIGDLDRDGERDLVCAGSDGTIWAFDPSLESLPGFPVTLDHDLCSAPVLGDIDADGYLDIVVAANNLVFALNYKGVVAEDFPVLVDRYHPTGPLTSPPIIIDPAGDRQAEILITTTAGELVSVYPAEADQPNPLVRSIGSPGLGTPAFGYDAVSGTAAVWAIGGDGYLYGFALPDSITSARGIFSQAGYDPNRTSVYPLDSLPEIPEREFLAESSVYAYPNPADGDHVYIHYLLGEEASIDVTIYDIAGNLIERIEENDDGHTENRVTWNCGDVASGVYFCRFAARSSSGESKVVFCPVAIAR